MNAYDAYVNRISNAWQGDEDEETKRHKGIVPDGGAVRVSFQAMDSIQQQIAGNDTGLTDPQKSMLDGMKRDADRVQAFADHFTAERMRQEQDSAGVYADYCRRLSDAWQNPGVAA